MIQVDDGGVISLGIEVFEARSGLVEVWGRIEQSLVKTVVIGTPWLPLRSSADDKELRGRIKSPEQFYFVNAPGVRLMG